MANFSVSPGVTTSEIDNTFLTLQPVQAGAAIIGPTVKGPVELPTLVTSYADYVNRFGDVLVSGSDTYSYFTSISAYNYFNNGGTSLIVARVVSGSYTPATSSLIANNTSVVVGNTASLTFDISTTLTGSATASFTGIKISYSGNDYFVVPNSSFNNNYSNPGDYFFTSSGVTTNANFTNYINAVVTAINDPGFDLKNVVGITASYSAPNLTIKAINGGTALNGVGVFKDAPLGIAGTLVGSLSGGTANASGESFQLETISEGIVMNSTSPEISGSLTSGSKDNLRWQITNANTASGTFNILIRQGNDNNNAPVILESWNNLSLDPNSSRYISRVIGDQVLEYNSTTQQIDTSTGSFANQSRYVRVKNVTPLPNYLNNNGLPVTAYTAYIPLNSTGSFGAATGDVKAGSNFYENINSSNTQGLVAGNYTNMINLLANKDDYQFNILSTPGLYNADYTSTISTIISNTTNRGDNLYVVDLVNFNGTLTDTITQATSRDTSYAATYWPWVRIIDPGTGKQIYVPASTLIPGVYAFNDRVAAPWFAPAGINRGGLSTVLRAKLKLSQSDRDTLYVNNINPIATFPRTGVSVFGQKTLQKGASALDRINVRRLLIELKSFISQVADTLVFEQNTITTRTNFLSRVNPYLETIQQKQGLYAFKIVMDDTNNTPDVIDRNQLIGQIYIQPSRTAEFIALDFILQPTGAQFPG